MTSKAKPKAEQPTAPSVLKDEEFHAAAKSVLREGESVADLIDRSARAEVERRRDQAAFIARGLASLKEMEETGVYYTADDIREMMRSKLEAAKAKLKFK